MGSRRQSIGDPLYFTWRNTRTIQKLPGIASKRDAMKQAILACLVFFTAFAAAPASAQQEISAQPLADFERVLDRAAQAPDFVGLAVAVVRDGEPVLIKTYGVREAGTNLKVTPDTVFRLASISKGFASTLAALEVQDHHLAWNDPVHSAVPELKLRTTADTAKLTIEHILSHRTGLPPFAYDNLLEAGIAPLEILGRYAQVRLICPVGDCYAYQNSTYNLIAPVIEAITGETYAERLKTRLLDPLGMRSTSLGSQGLISTGNWAMPHIRRGGSYEAVPVKEAYYRLPAAAGVNSSINDMATWLAAMIGDRPDVVPPAVLDDLRASRTSTPADLRRHMAQKMPTTRTAYGLGWRTYDYAGHDVVAHSGSVQGYAAQIAYLPQRGSGIVILSNTRGARASKLVPTRSRTRPHARRLAQAGRCV